MPCFNNVWFCCNWNPAYTLAQQPCGFVVSRNTACDCLVNWLGNFVLEGIGGVYHMDGGSTHICTQNTIDKSYCLTINIKTVSVCTGKNT